MSKSASRSIFASFFALWLAACGSGDDDGNSDVGTVTDPSTDCITLQGNPCSCPGAPIGTYGVFACDGSCSMCAPPAAGASGGGGTGAAGMTATGLAGRPGGDMTPPRAGTSGLGTGPGRGAAGMSGFAGAAPLPAAGSMAMPTAGSMAGAAGMPATTTGDVPETDACMAAAMWNADWAAFEVEVLRLTNEARAKGYNCDTMGEFGPAPPLEMDARLRCSARLHSKDMAERRFFDHDTPEGTNPGARMKAAGFVGSGWAENIAKGQQTPADVVQGWLESDGHCSNIMEPRLTLLGVGYFAGMATNPRFNSELYWTQNFGTPARR